MVSGSFYFLFQSIKFRRGEKITQGNIQSITEFFDGRNGDVPADRVHHAIGRGGRCPGSVCQFIDANAFFFAQRQKARGNSVFYARLDHLEVMVKKIT